MGPPVYLKHKYIFIKICGGDEVRHGSLIINDLTQIKPFSSNRLRQFMLHNARLRIVVVKPQIVPEEYLKNSRGVLWGCETIRNFLAVQSRKAS